MTPAPRDIPDGLRQWLADKCLTPAEINAGLQLYQYTAEHGYPPTMRELADLNGLAHVTVYGYVRAMVRKGAIVRRGAKQMARCYRLAWVPPARDLAGECERLRTALQFYSAQAVGGEVARDALEGKR
jgi:DNA-binding MarR family transcriptional regulator